ncbi:hypothetical protein HanIR_Chr10g0460761 [Helianthus annuus]|nr:hypothetical protein HanIR_Chr10g0460761 [Helianthus annuus]
MRLMLKILLWFLLIVNNFVYVVFRLSRSEVVSMYVKGIILLESLCRRLFLYMGAV